MRTELMFVTGMKRTNRGGLATSVRWEIRKWSVQGHSVANDPPETEGSAVRLA
jgi:hypothetical protein